MAFGALMVDRIFRWADRLYRGIDHRLGGRLTLLVRTALAFDQDDGALMSRSIAYYALFSLFPLLLVLVSFSSSVLASEEANKLVMDMVETYLPAASELVKNNLDQVLQTRSTVGIIALVGLIWSASGVFTAIYRSINRAWGNPKSELFWSEKIFGVAVVVIVGLLLVGTTIYSTVASVVRQWRVGILDWQPLVNLGEQWGWLSILFPLLVTIGTFIILYRTIPRNSVRWRDVWLGGLLAGAIWEGARQVFAWYLASFARYSLIYGSVGAIIGFLFWAYLSAMIILLGAEFSAQYTAWRQAGRPVESRPVSQWLNEWSK